MSKPPASPASRACARCGRAVRTGGARWPEGYLCGTCHTHALETYGPCAGCGVDRLTPGIAPDGGRLCTDCAGGLGEFTLRGLRPGSSTPPPRRLRELRPGRAASPPAR